MTGLPEKGRRGLRDEWKLCREEVAEDEDGQLSQLARKYWEMPEMLFHG